MVRMPNRQKNAKDRKSIVVVQPVAVVLVRYITRAYIDVKTVNTIIMPVNAMARS